MNLFIGNLDYGVKEQELKELFEQVGEVSSAKIITDKFTGRSKGFAFVEMPNDADGQKAVDSLNGQMLRSREIAVSQARPKTEGSGGGGGYNNRPRREHNN